MKATNQLVGVIISMNTTQDILTWNAYTINFPNDIIQNTIVIQTFVEDFCIGATKVLMAKVEELEARLEAALRE